MNSKQKKRKLTTRDVVVLAVFGALLIALKQIMALLPNIHLTAALIVALTVVYRANALYPIYVFVFLSGLLNGFGTWWIPYLYVWTVLWGVVMLLPKSMPKKVSAIVYMIVCALHGFLFGILYAPVQALLFGLDFKGMIAWIVAGFYFDFVHGVSNFCCGLLILPIINVINRFTNATYKDYKNF